MATRQITAAHPNIPVIIFSVVDNDATRQAAHQAGATAFVAKGDAPGEICSTVLATWQSTSKSSRTR